MIRRMVVTGVGASRSYRFQMNPAGHIGGRSGFCSLEVVSFPSGHQLNVRTLGERGMTLAGAALGLVGVFFIAGRTTVMRRSG